MGRGSLPNGDVCKVQPPSGLELPLEGCNPKREAGVEVIFIRHTEEAEEVDEEHFFLVPLIAITLLLGVFPNVILHLVDGPVQQLLNSFTSLP